MVSAEDWPFVDIKRFAPGVGEDSIAVPDLQIRAMVSNPTPVRHGFTVLFFKFPGVPFVSVLRSMTPHSVNAFDPALALGHATFLRNAEPADRLERDAEELSAINAPPKMPDPVSLSGVVDAILEVGRQRKSLLDQMRSALLSGSDAEAISCARRLCGLPNEGTHEKSH